MVLDEELCRQVGNEGGGTYCFSASRGNAAVASLSLVFFGRLVSCVVVHVDASDG